MARELRIAVFGASGGTGQALVAAALADGHRVRALFRPGSTPGQSHEGLEVLRGQLAEAQDVGRTVAGCQAVICVFGPRPGQSDLFCARATQTIVEAMRAEGVDRLVCQTGAMIGDWDANRAWSMRLMAGLFRRGNPALAADRARQEAIVQASGLVWTLVKPPRIVADAPATAVRAGAGLRLGMMSHVSRAGLARFLLDEAAHPRFPRQAVFVAD